MFLGFANHRLSWKSAGTYDTCDVYTRHAQQGPSGNWFDRCKLLSKAKAVLQRRKPWACQTGFCAFTTGHSGGVGTRPNKNRANTLSTSLMEKIMSMILLCFQFRPRADAFKKRGYAPPSQATFSNATGAPNPKTRTTSRVRTGRFRV